MTQTQNRTWTTRNATERQKGNNNSNLLEENEKQFPWHYI